MRELAFLCLLSLRCFQSDLVGWVKSVHLAAERCCLSLLFDSRTRRHCSIAAGRYHFASSPCYAGAADSDVASYGRMCSQSGW